MFPVLVPFAIMFPVLTMLLFRNFCYQNNSRCKITTIKWQLKGKLAKINKVLRCKWVFVWLLVQIRVQMKHLPYLRFSGSSVKVHSTFCLIVWGWLKKAIKNKEYFRFSWKKKFQDLFVVKSWMKLFVEGSANLKPNPRDFSHVG